MEIYEALENLKEGESAIIRDAPDRISLALYPLTLEKLNTLLSDNKFVFAFCMMMRPGNSLFQRYLELKYFHPESPNNDLLLCIFHKWQGLLWTITGVPRVWSAENQTYNGEAYMQEAIQYAKLRAVEDGYVPLMIGGDGEPNTEFFGTPAHKPLFDMTNVIYLENQSGHLFYVDKQAAEEEQSRMIQELEEQYL